MVRGRRAWGAPLQAMVAQQAVEFVLRTPGRGRAHPATRAIIRLKQKYIHTVNHCTLKAQSRGTITLPQRAITT